MFSDEKMILDIRLNVLNEYIDHFVIVESKYKHDGSIKKQNFDINVNPDENEPDNIDAQEKSGVEKKEKESFWKKFKLFEKE